MSKLRGTTAECLKDYASTLPPKASRDVRVSRLPLVEFTGTSIDTVDRWILGRVFPIGLPLIKLSFFLEMLGYEVVDIIHLGERYYRLASVLALNIMSVDDAMVFLGFTNSNSIFRICFGRGEIAPNKLSTLDSLWDAHKNEVKHRFEAWKTKLNLEATSFQTANHSQESPVISTARIREFRSKEQNLRLMAYLVLAMGDLAEEIASDTYTAEERKNLREMTDGNCVFRLSNALNKLCGEKARELIIAKEGKK